MPSVDDRQVKMEFDNAAFERKLENTMRSLSQLDKALKFEGASKGFGDVNDAANKLDFRTISQGVENVSRGFLAMSAVAFTVLQNITNRAIQAGAEITQALTIAPVMDGFREYETNMTSIQTILANTASKGTTLDDVTAALDKLNQYSDQTIYNFGQMARNIGTFTAAGVDLQTSVDSIKGIANLAAMSGSTSEQAATAMYQLSQAIAAGSVKLMDWNSVVNAGMGGEAFKSALFETQKVMGNVLNVPLGQTFTEWEDAGNSFRESLQDGWITADVLTTTLQAFTGDMTEEMLLAKGFTEDQALNILKTAAIAKAAATEVKTFTQLMSTTKEAIGTGWADTFRLIIGNFTEAKQLWTDVSTSVSGFINKMADARNEMFSVWRFLGGREDLIAGLKAAFGAVGEVLGTLRDAFRNIFPATTGFQLVEWTDGFRKFAEALKPSADTLLKLDSIFTGFFSVLSIGWTIIKEGFGLFWDLAQVVKQAFGGKATESMATLGDAIYRLKLSLVDGGKIHEFFTNLGKVLQIPIKFIAIITAGLGSIFHLWPKSASDSVSDTLDKMGGRFDTLRDSIAKMGGVWAYFENALNKVKDILENIWDTVSSWFRELGDRLAKTMKTGDFDSILKFINTGLLGGIAVLLAKFLKDGIKLDIGDGLIGKIGAAFDQLTNSLAAMQANLKAQALLNIAIAIAVLTASVLVLSLIDPVRLASALTAMGVGFGQLLASFSVMTKIVANPKVATKFAVVSGGLIAVAAAMLILSVAMKILSTMSWKQIGKGLAATIGLIVALSVAAKLMSKNAISFAFAGVGITAMAVALSILTIPMKIFATMSWKEIAKGLGAVAGLLGAVAIGMRLMPNGLKVMSVGVGLLAVAGALILMATASAMFAMMEWESIAKGLAGIGGGLVLLAGALKLMPYRTPIVAAGLVLMGIALNEMGIAMKIFASMTWDEIARGLVAMGGALAILAAGLWAIGEVGFAVLALPVAAIGLSMLADVVKKFAHIEWDTIKQGLLKLAAAFGAIAGISLLLQGAAPAIAIFGGALILLGLGVLAMGVGINELAKGIKTLMSLGSNAGKVIKDIAVLIIKLIPDLAKALAEGLVDFIKVFTDAAPAMAKSIGVLVGVIVDVLYQNIPKIAVLLERGITFGLLLIREKAPEFIKTGIWLIIKLLEGVEKKIGKIIDTIADIVINALEAFRERVPDLAKSYADTIIVMFETVAYEVGRVSGTLLIGVGKNFMKGLKDGIDSSTGGLASKVLAIPGKIVGWIGNVLSTLWQKGVDLLTGLWNGITSAIVNVYTFFTNLPANILGHVADMARTLWDKGLEVIGGLLGGIVEKFGEVAAWFGGLPAAVKEWITGAGEWLLEGGKNVIQGFWDGLKSIWHKVVDWVKEKMEDLIDKIKRPWEIFSPSRVMKRIGGHIMGGWLIGLQEGYKPVDEFMTDLGVDKADGIKKNMTEILSDVYNKMSDISDASPTITPVLDLTGVRKDAAGIKNLMAGNTIGSSLSFKQAQIVIRDSKKTVDGEDSRGNQDKAGISFVQNNYSPSALSASDIYRQTRNQITLAKEELKIP